MKQSVSLFLVTFLAFVFVQTVQAGLPNAVYWSFDPPAPSASAVSNSFSGLTVSDFARGNDQGSGLYLFNATSASSGYTTAAGFDASGGTNAVANALNGALDLNASAYFSTALAMDVSLSYYLAITNVSLGSRSTGTGPGLLSLYGSIDDFASDFESLGSTAVLTNSTWSGVAFDLTSFSLNINPGETYSLRLYGSDGLGTASLGNWRVDDVAIAVTATPVPEPSTLAMGILGGLAGLMLIRRKNLTQLFPRN